MGHQELVTALTAETHLWPRTGSSADKTVRAAFQLVCEAAGGVLMIIGPHAALRRLRQNCNPAGAMLTKQLRGLSIWDEDFRRFFLSFTTPVAPRAPVGKLDGKSSQSQFQDAVLLVATTGDILMCSTAVAGLPPAPLVWPGYGRRHTAALEVASFLDRVVVIVRSDGGAVHALARRSNNMLIAWRLQAGPWSHRLAKRTDGTSSERVDRDGLRLQNTPSHPRTQAGQSDHPGSMEFSKMKSPALHMKADIFPERRPVHQQIALRRPTPQFRGLHSVHEPSAMSPPPPWIVPA